MPLDSLLDPIIYRFQSVLGSQNFAHFVTYVLGLMYCEGRHTVTNLYLLGKGHSSYWALIKFVSRARFEVLPLVECLLTTLLFYIPERYYIYDHTHAIKTGKGQYGLHFFRNHRYRTRNRNQSKFHWGHEFAGLGLLGLSGAACYLFPLWVKMIEPGAPSALSAFEQIISILPPGLIIFDRGFNNRKYFKRLLTKQHHLLCRARSNMVFYYLPQEAEQPKRGRKRIYGKRADFRHWPYETVPIEALGQDAGEIASRIVRSKSCPQPIHLVVRRTRAKKSKPYRYFLVYTTDLSLSVETIMRLYRRRWTFETAMHDSKESFGFDHYQLRSEQAINRHVQLSFIAASLVQLLALPAFVETHGKVLPGLKDALAQMNIHWYHPTRWTLGLLLKFLKWTRHDQTFSASSMQHNTTRKCETAHYHEAAG